MTINKVTIKRFLYRWTRCFNSRMKSFVHEKIVAWILQACKYEISMHENDIFMHENGISVIKIYILPKISYGMIFFTLDIVMGNLAVHYFMHEILIHGNLGAQFSFSCMEIWFSWKEINEISMHGNEIIFTREIFKPRFLMWEIFRTGKWHVLSMQTVGMEDWLEIIATEPLRPVYTHEGRMGSTFESLLTYLSRLAWRREQTW